MCHWTEVFKSKTGWREKRTRKINNSQDTIFFLLTSHFRNHMLSIRHLLYIKICSIIDHQSDQTIEHECKKNYIHYLQVYYCKEDEVCLYQSLLFEVPFEEGVSNPAKADVTLAHFVKPETSTSNFLLSVTPWVCGTLNQVLLPLLSLAHLLFIFLYILVIL